MKHVLAFLFTLTCCFVMAQTNHTDTYNTPMGILSITPLGHGSVRMEIAGKVIQVDPYSEIHDYTNDPKGDLILITHDHYDHLDAKALKAITKPESKFIGNPDVAKALNQEQVETLKNGDRTTWEEIVIHAVPAYNIIQKNEKGQHFHPKGAGNGYILDFNGFRVYIAGDTELIPEMKNIENIDVAFLPKNLPYTMNDKMFVEAAKTIRAKVLYPYHFFDANKTNLQKELQGISSIK
jgi:L-ascorbate metabolism protein UlaG (beta-lactamase superfamily)